ncbi:MAG: hypothetical protein GWO81_02190 [Verrucomicrobia bacterium]|nr:hypothetical protein [Verrucomicrobiota bacterium]
MASTNDNLFTSFPKGRQRLTFRHTISGKVAWLHMEWLDGRLQTAELKAVSSNRGQARGALYEFFWNG